MNEIFLADIYDQPQAIRTSLPILRQQAKIIRNHQDNFHRIFFVGSGDSYIAGLSLAYAARKYTKREIHVASSHDALAYGHFNRHDLFVPISISGGTKRTIMAAEKAKSDGAFVLPISCYPESALSQLGNEKLTIPFKSRTRLSPHSADYMTTLLAIASIIEVFAGGPFGFLDNLDDVIQEVLDQSYQQSINLGKKLSNRERYFFFGNGPNYGTCFYGAAKFWEARGMVACHFDLDEVGHGFQLMLEPNDAVIIPITQGNSYNRTANALKSLAVLKINTTVITDKPEGFEAENLIPISKIDEEWAPFLTCIPIQLLCWAISNAKGYEVSTGSRYYGQEDFDTALTYMRGE